MNFMEKLNEVQVKELASFIEEPGRKAEEVKRAQGILLLAQNQAKTFIKMLTGLKRATLVKIRKKYIKEGIGALINKRKDKQPRSLLTKNQLEEVRVILHTKTPRDYGRECDFWTPTILGNVILEMFGVKYKSKTSLYLIFKKLKLTCHKPEKRYEKRDQKAIEEWREKVSPEIQKALKDPNTVVLVSDEMILTSQTTLQKVWFPEGQVPTITCSNTRTRISLYGFLNIKTGEEFAFKADRQTSETSAQILKKVLEHYKGYKILLIWDNAPWHRGAAMRAFLALCSNLHILNFPPYAPEENPQEHVWKEGRAKVTHNTFISDIHKSVRELISYLNNTIFKYSFFGFVAS